MKCSAEYTKAIKPNISEGWHVVLKMLGSTIFVCGPFATRGYAELESDRRNKYHPDLYKQH